MILMTVMGLLLVVGVVVTLRWGGIAYRPWDPEAGDGTGPAAAAPALPPSVRTVALRYLRGVAIALVAGFWAGALVTGPAVRLIMRLLAVTAGDDAQGGITEADEVVGEIDLGGTIGLYIFGGLLPGLLSGAIYVLVRRWLPAGMLGGVVFGALHLVIAATRLDPLRPENPDFDLVGPGWLSVTTFGLACVFHGMAVAAIANRYSTELPPVVTSRAAWIRALVPLGLPALFVLFPIFAAALLVGLALTIGISRIVPAVRAARSRRRVVRRTHRGRRRGPRLSPRHDHRPPRRDRPRRRRRFGRRRLLRRQLDERDRGHRQVERELHHSFARADVAGRLQILEVVGLVEGVPLVPVRPRPPGRDPLPPSR